MISPVCFEDGCSLLCQFFKVDWRVVDGLYADVDVTSLRAGVLVDVTMHVHQVVAAARCARLMLALVQRDMAEVQLEVVELALEVNAFEEAATGKEFDVIVVAYDEILAAVQPWPKGLEAVSPGSAVVHEHVTKVVNLVAFAHSLVPLVHHMLVHLVNVFEAGSNGQSRAAVNEVEDIGMEEVANVCRKLPKYY